MFVLLIPFALAALVGYLLVSWAFPAEARLPGLLGSLKPKQVGPGVGYFDGNGWCRFYRAPNGRLYAAGSPLTMLQWARGIGLPTGAEPSIPENGKPTKPKRTFGERAGRGAAGASFGSVLGGAVGGALGLLLPPGNVVGAAAGAAAGSAIGAGLGGGVGAAT